ncbi:DCC1-like thiol-disulfide oxidoreductase family protein [Salinibacillus aidingensis]|uniref:DCC1-like thiol-disulfide oxidoreductase family protein n=1 Tax=Salinibacillus aidingensis TaxID=237684 RepID=A0ABN1BEW0_9BACI
MKHPDKILYVFYDSWCPICRKAKAKIEKADKNHVIILLSIRDSSVYEEYHLTGKNVEERIYSIRNQDGKSFTGIFAILEIAKRIPKYKPLVPFLYISIILGFGQKVYDYIASRREIVPTGHCNEDSCSIHLKED